MDWFSVLPFTKITKFYMKAVIKSTNYKYKVYINLLKERS